MRSVGLVLVLGLAACAARSHGPAWPKMAQRDDDGGESIAPRQPSAITEAAATSDDDDAPAAAAETASAAKPADAADAAQPTLGAPVVAPEEVINVDDIVIEINDDD